MTDSSSKPIRVVIAGSDIPVTMLLRGMFERFQFNPPMQVVESLVLDEAQVIENVSTICDYPADWVFLISYHHLHTVDHVVQLIKQAQPQIKVAALSVVMQEKELAEPQHLDYLHYYPTFSKHIQEVVDHLLNI